MSYLDKARQNRANAVQSIAARRANVFADDFDCCRRPRPLKK